MGELFIGWDVGAWNCDRNRESRDALCALDLSDSGPVLVGTPWRGNLRDLLVAHAGHDLVAALLRRLDVGADESRHVRFAIDTPLAWPRRMLELVTAGTCIDVPIQADNNPYLFRVQEVSLFGHEQRPLSVVRDMIGSQSTKGIHFLHRAQLAPMTVGVWGHASTTVIETYPAAAVADFEVSQLSASLLADLLGEEKTARNGAWRSDVRDAIICALIAMLHRYRPERLVGPGTEAEPAEGWIWLPKTHVA